MVAVASATSTRVAACCTISAVAAATRAQPTDAADTVARPAAASAAARQTSATASSATAATGCSAIGAAAARAPQALPQRLPKAPGPAADSQRNDGDSAVAVPGQQVH